MSNTSTRSPSLISSATLVLAGLALVGCGDDRADQAEQTDLLDSPAQLRGFDEGLELHWTFEDRDGPQILDLSGNGRHGTVHGGSFIASPTGEALSLDGVDDYVSFSGPRSPSLYGGVDGAFTISARVRVADVHKYNTLCYGCGPSNVIYIGTPSYDSRVMSAVFDQGSNGLTWPLSTPSLPEDAWVEVTMIVDGGVGTRYYLGCVLDSEIVNPNVGLKDYNFSSLGAGADASRWFEGEIDELRVWNRALSEAEVAELCPTSPLEQGLELHWTFEDRDGAQILDMSGNGRHGTLHGGGTFVASSAGEAVRLDGLDDYISFAGPRAPSLYGGVDGDFTLNARVRVADLSKDNTLCYGCGPFNLLYVGTATYGPRAMTAVWNQDSGNLLWPWTSPSLIEDTWVDLTMVVEGGVGVRYYLDCSLDSELLDDRVGLKDYGSSTVGRGAIPSRWFEGEIDDLRIWSRALSDAEIAGLCPAPPPLEAGLEVHWTFEDRVGNTILDLSGNDRHGTLHDGTFVSSPTGGEAISFDGVDDHITFMVANDLAPYGGPDGSFTVSTLLRVRDVFRLNTFCVGCGPFNRLIVGSLTTTHRNVVYANVGNSFPTSSQTLAPDTWVEVTLVVEGGVGGRIYFDGVLDTELLDSSIALKANGNYLSSLGRGVSNSLHWFEGEVDEFRLWSRALSEAEVAEIVAGRPALRSGLELYWTFDYNWMEDWSGHRRPGINHGGVYVDSPGGRALSLDGVDDYVRFGTNLPAHPFRNPALYGGVDGKFTISSRVRVADVESINTLCYGCGPFNTLALGQLAGGNRAWAKIFDQSSSDFLSLMSSSALVDDTWVEVTLTIDGGVGARLYLDCALESELVDANVGLKDYGYSSLGEGDSESSWFGGEVEKFRIWSRVLAEHEVAGLCQW